VKQTHSYYEFTFSNDQLITSDDEKWPHCLH